MSVLAHSRWYGRVLRTRQDQVCCASQFPAGAMPQDSVTTSCRHLSLCRLIRTWPSARVSQIPHVMARCVTSPRPRPWSGPVAPRSRFPHEAPSAFASDIGEWPACDEHVTRRRVPQIACRTSCGAYDLRCILGRRCGLEVVAGCVDREVGIVQLPCPEQQAWGGVLMRTTLREYGMRGTAHNRVRSIRLAAIVLYAKVVYRRLTRQVAARVRDYRRTGFSMVSEVPAQV